MPQKKRKSAEEILGLAPRRPSAEEVLGIAPRPAPSRPAAQAQPSQDADSLLTNALEAAKSGGRYLYSGLSNTADAVGSFFAGGDPRKLRNVAETTGRGALKLPDSISAARTGNPATATIQDPAIQRLAQERLQNSPELQAIAERDKQYEALAARNPSRTAKVVRGVARVATEVAPTLIAGAVSGGSVPVMATTAALSSMGNPEALPSNIALTVIPLPSVAPIIRRIRGGRGAVVGTEEAVTPTIARETAPLSTPEPFPNAPTTNPLPRSILENAETTAFPGTLPPAATPAARVTAEVARPASTPTAAPVAAESMVQSRWPRGMQAPQMRLPDEPLGTVTGAPEVGANLRELDDFFTNQAQVAQKPTSPLLHQVVGNSADDVAMVNVADMGLEVATVPQRAAGAKAVARTISVDDITLGRDNLSKGRMFQVQEALKNGVKPEKRGVPLREQVDPITVVPDPARPGKYIVEDDSNHRTAFLKLLGYTDEIPVKSFETKAQTAAINARPASVSGPKVGETAALNVGGSGGGTGGSGSGGTSGAPNPAQTITAAERTPVLEVVSALRKAGLLTGVKTHLKNIGGSAGFQISEELTRIPGAIVDMMISPFTKRRTFTGPNFGAMARSAQEAATKGLREAKGIIRKGGTPEELAAQEIRQVNSGSKILDTYINGTFRLLSAEDRVFRVYAMRRALEDRARSAALTEIRQGAIPRGDYGKRVKELLDAPPEDLAAAAAADAEMAVFANDNLVSKGREAVRGVLKPTGAGRVADFAIDQIFPFVKTPTNVIARMLEYSGVTSGPKAAYLAAKAMVKRSMSEAEQRAFAQNFGRASIGAGLIALGYKGYQDGWLTGLVENDLTRRARDAAAGRIPGAIKVGDTWHQLTGFAPLGNLLAIGATLARETDQEKEGAGILPALDTLGDVVLEQPLLAGSKQVIKGLEEPGTTGGRALGGIAGSFVPTAISDIGELADPTQRQASTITERVQQRIPGARNFLPERQDVLGRPVEDRATQIVDPTRTTTDEAETNPLFRELVRLDAGISGFRKAGDEADGLKAQRFGQLYTQYGQRLVSDPQYAKASDEIRLGALKVLNDRSKDLVTKGRERYAPQALSAPFLLDAARRSAQNAARKRAR